MDVGAGQILLAGSGSHTIDLVCRYFLHPGDTVLVDDPCYFNFHAVLGAHRTRIITVPMTKTGPNLALFADTLAAHRPRLYLTNSAIHYPTGVSLSPMVAHRILTLAAKHELIIVEDDIFSDFEPEPSPRLAVKDGISNVVRIGSFSKTLSASIRCGYLAAVALPLNLRHGALSVKFGSGKVLGVQSASNLFSYCHDRRVDDESTDQDRNGIRLGRASGP